MLNNALSMGEKHITHGTNSVSILTSYNGKKNRNGS